MTSQERMGKNLQTTGLYDLKGNSLILAESNAYATVLDELYQQLEEMLRQCFFDEVISGKVEFFEDLFGLPRTEMFPLVGIEKKRAEKTEAMKKRLSIKNNDFSKEAILRLLESWGLTVTLQEKIDDKEIHVKIISNKKFLSNVEDRDAMIRSIMPCHSSVTIS